MADYLDIELNKVIRPYEVSVWTLQDDFITILKFSDIENKGQIEQPKMRLNVDGTQDFTFSIPMYFYQDGNLIENPNWYNTKNGNIIINLRKIKVIFNKNTVDEKVFEFEITKIEESHDTDILMCNITCEGLAFHELGKIGYKISLHAEDFYKDYEDWLIDNTKGANIANLQYWLNKFLVEMPVNGIIDPNTWYYQIKMDWTAFSLLDNNQERDSNKVYEDEYISDWNVNSHSLTAKTIESSKEKSRMIDLEESNIYNLTQNIAEVFGVFCRYEYVHDDNYHIIGRKIIFYNNFYSESQGYLNFTYPYDSSKITRGLDSTDTITKLFVRPLSGNSDSGLITIMDVAANKSREDYVLNFDYLKAVGTISEEQYTAIDEFEANMNRYNSELIPLESQILYLEEQIPELEAKKAIAENAIILDQERIAQSNDLLNALTNGTSVLHVTANKPDTPILLKDENASNNGPYYINLTRLGIDGSTVHVYKTFNFQTISINNENLTVPFLSDEITSFNFSYDENGNINGLNNIWFIQYAKPESNLIYLTYDYTPSLYYEKVKQNFLIRLAKDAENKQNYQNKLNEISQILNGDSENIGLKTSYKNKLLEKQELIKKFEKMMGPALREGYWQPEEYNDYGTFYSNSYDISDFSNILKTKENSPDNFFFDNELFEEEQRLDYTIGITENHKNYPCIDLSNYIDIVKAHKDEICFMFYDYIRDDNTIIEVPKNIRSFGIGSGCELAYISNNSEIKPVLILTCVETLPEKFLVNGFNLNIEDYLKTKYAGAKIGALTSVINNNNATAQFENWTINLAFRDWQPITNSVKLVYPRIEIQSPSLKNSEDNLQLIFSNKNNGEIIKLNNYEDFYVLTKNKVVQENNNNVYKNYYYITLKPSVLFNYFEDYNLNISYVLSNADVAIYLDALQVLKDNAYPKVSYKITPNIFNDLLLKTLYNNLSRIININDFDLKFENIQGYISEIELSLDSPWEDSIEIINYKTKFEDLFSNIIAQTEEMKKKSYILDLTSQIFTATGDINQQTLQSSLHKVNLNYAFNNGTLTIDESNGIWGTSDAGVFAIRGGGIFTATEKDENGAWRWNTGITPNGINADAITSGRLNTNDVMIYSGDKLRIRINGEGITAFKSFYEDLEYLGTTEWEGNNISINEVNQRLADGDIIDSSQYVKFNENGLFLIAKKNALILNSTKTDYIKIGIDPDTGTEINDFPDELQRVAITWDGITLRNYQNDEVFFMDPDTGNLHIKGAIYADSLYIGNNNKNIINADGTLDSSTIWLSVQGKHYYDLPDNADTITSQAYIKLGYEYTTDIQRGGSNYFNDCVLALGVRYYNGSTDTWQTANTILMTSKKIDISAGASLNITSGSFLTISNSQNGNVIEMDQDGMVLKSNGILKISGNAGIIVESNGAISMTAGGNFSVNATTGYINFGTSGTTNFSVDVEGNVYCKNLICTNITATAITGNGNIIAAEEASPEPTPSPGDNSQTTNSFTPSTGYLPGSCGQSGTFTTKVFLDGAPYNKADINLYFPGSTGSWTSGTAYLYVNDQYVTEKIINNSNSSLIITANNVSVTIGSPIVIQVRVQISNAAQYVHSFNFNATSSSVVCHT